MLPTQDPVPTPSHAFPHLFRRTADQLWLDRALTEARQQYRSGRYALWTGDLAYATGVPQVPLLDSL